MRTCRTDRQIIFRIGINIGDIIIEGGDIFGDGVNVAARLEALCEPGGLCISRAANEQIRDKLSLAFADRGEQTVKNIARSVGVFGLGALDIARLPAEALLELPGESSVVPAAMPEQQIRFCRSSDGVQIAYSFIGSGPPLVKTGNWMTHLEKDLESPIWRHLWRDMARDHTLLRYDARGNGLSDWEVEEISFEAFVRDLEAVVDAAGVEKFDSARNFPGMRRIDSLCGTASRTGESPCSLRRILRRLGKANTQRSGKGTVGRHGDADAPGLGTGELGVPPDVHVAVRA